MKERGQYGKIRNAKCDCNHFKEAGIAAIERSKRGIVALILEEEQSIIDELTTNKNAIVGSSYLW